MLRQQNGCCVFQFVFPALGFEWLPSHEHALTTLADSVRFVLCVHDIIMRTKLIRIETTSGSCLLYLRSRSILARKRPFTLTSFGLESISDRIKNASVKPSWPNGQGVGLLCRRLRVRVPSEVA